MRPDKRRHPHRSPRPSRGGHQMVWLYGRHPVLAALANPERRIEQNPSASLGRTRAGLEGDAACHLVKPAAHGLPLADRSSLAGQCEKRRLEGVFGVLAVVQDAPADTEHNALVTADDQLERRLIRMRDEAREELCVAGASGAAFGACHNVP